MVADIKRRNPALSKWPFVTVQSDKVDRPFPVIGATLLGPLSAVPFNHTANDYAILEINPISVGKPRAISRRYVSTKSSRSVSLMVGGLVENFAFGGGSGNASRLGSQQASGTLSGSSVVTDAFTVSHAASASGWAAADVISTKLPPHGLRL